MQGQWHRWWEVKPRWWVESMVVVVLNWLDEVVGDDGDGVEWVMVGPGLEMGEQRWKADCGVGDGGGGV